MDDYLERRKAIVDSANAEFRALLGRYAKALAIVDEYFSPRLRDSRQKLLQDLVQFDRENLEKFLEKR